MSRKNYIILNILFFIPILIGILLGNNLGQIIVLLSILLLLLYTAYLLIYKKSYNILAGMTEELYESTRKIPEEKERYEKQARIIGYLFIFVGIIISILIFSKLKDLIC